MTARWLITVDESLCTGSGLCVGSAPDTFEFGPTQRSRPLAVEVDADDAVLHAAECCPMEAISVRDASTGASVLDG